jgi:hypothetical protein
VVNARNIKCARCHTSGHHNSIEPPQLLGRHLGRQLNIYSIKSEPNSKVAAMKDYLPRGRFRHVGHSQSGPSLHHSKCCIDTAIESTRHDQTRSSVPAYSDRISSRNRTKEALPKLQCWASSHCDNRHDRYSSESSE